MFLPLILLLLFSIVNLLLLLPINFLHQIHPILSHPLLVGPPGNLPKTIYIILLLLIIFIILLLQLQLLVILVNLLLVKSIIFILIEMAEIIIPYILINFLQLLLLFPLLLLLLQLLLLLHQLLPLSLQQILLNQLLHMLLLFQQFLLLRLFFTLLYLLYLLSVIMVLRLLPPFAGFLTLLSMHRLTIRRNVALKVSHTMDIYCVIMQRSSYPRNLTQLLRMSVFPPLYLLHTVTLLLLLLKIHCLNHAVLTLNLPLAPRFAYIIISIIARFQVVGFA